MTFAASQEKLHFEPLKRYGKITILTSRNRNLPRTLVFTLYNGGRSQFKRLRSHVKAHPQKSAQFIIFFS